MGRKPGTGTTAVTKEVEPAPERMITEVHNLLGAKLHVGNTDYVRALLAAYDQALAEILARQEIVVAKEIQIAGLETQVDDALALLNQHLTGRVYTDLDDALRNLLQAYVSLRDSAAS